jgi:L-Ala-D/L-Glu epimerase
MTSLTARTESWPIRGAFTISRGSKTAAEVIVAQVEHKGAAGRGECVPYARYGETLESVMTQIGSVADYISQGGDRMGLQRRLPAGAARNAVDCALWDLEAKLIGTPVWRLAGLQHPEPVTTAYTISLGEPDKMARDAAQAALTHPLLKLKLGGDGDVDRIAAIRESAPHVRLIADANEAWTVQQIVDFGPSFRELGVELIEQPLPAGEDHALTDIQSTVPLCADESCHDTASMVDIKGKYSFVNVKLDKTGGLTEALRLVKACQDSNTGIMVGCMVATSLAMAPATLIANSAAYVDLDGPLLLAEDRLPALDYTNSLVSPPASELWG